MSQQDNKGFASVQNLARLSHAIASITKGAMTAGIHGAAIAGAKEFAPEILKILAYIILLSVLLPFFLFLSIVGSNFQFPSVDDPDVVAMNNQSIIVGSLYNQFHTFTMEEVNSIIDSLSAGHDDVVVTKNIGNTDNYWLTCISSVSQDQDLYRISEQTVRNLTIDNLDYSSHVEVYTVEDEDGDEIECTRIYIDIWDIGATKLMEKQGFNTFQTEWAGFLRDNLLETQLVDPNDPNYSGDMVGVDLGDITFSDGSTEVVYYSQMDSRWCNELYGKTQTIGYAGCGPTALAMVVSSLTDTQINPKEMADWASENGYVAEGNGSYRTLIPDGAKEYGLSVTGAGKDDAQDVIDALSDGKLVIAIMGPSTFTTSGHFLVLRGVTSEGELLVADSVSYSKSQKAWDAQIIFDEAKNSSAADGPFWIIG